MRPYYIFAGVDAAHRAPTAHVETVASGGSSAPVDPELYALRPWYHDFSALGFDTTFLRVPLTPAERLRRAYEVEGAVLARAWRGTRTTPIPRERARSPREVLRRVPSQRFSHASGTAARRPTDASHIIGA